MDYSVRNKILEIFGEDCIVNNAVAHGCRADLRGIPSNDCLIVDADLFSRQRSCSTKRCDFVLFIQPSSIGQVVCVLIELKSGDHDASNVKEQLQCTANYLAQVLAFGEVGQFNVSLFPLLLRNKGLHPRKESRIKEATVRFRGRTSLIYLGGCKVDGNVFGALCKFLRREKLDEDFSSWWS